MGDSDIHRTHDSFYGDSGGPNGHSSGYSRGITSFSAPWCTSRVACGGSPVRSNALAVDVQSSMLTNANASELIERGPAPPRRSTSTRAAAAAIAPQT